MKSFAAGFVMLLVANSFVLQAQKGAAEIYELRVYRLKNQSQQERVDGFLKNSVMPTLHKSGIKNVGVFKPIESDTTFGKRVYVLIPYSSIESFSKVSQAVKFDSGSSDYVDAPYTDPPFDRLETTMLRAFEGMKKLETPSLSAARGDRIYELRSYEGPTEKIYRNKVHMFNQGDEIGLFRRLGFNAVFYADVIVGSRMPNLMYMTAFSNRTARDEHWKTFSADPQWKKLSGMDEYQHNVSKINIYLLHPTEYSDY